MDNQAQVIHTYGIQLNMNSKDVTDQLSIELPESLLNQRQPTSLTLPNGKKLTPTPKNTKWYATITINGVFFHYTVKSKTSTIVMSWYRDAYNSWCHDIIYLYTDYKYQPDEDILIENDIESYMMTTQEEHNMGVGCYIGEYIIS